MQDFAILWGRVQSRIYCVVVLKGIFLVIVEQALRRVYVAIANLTWPMLSSITLLHTILSYVLLALAGESALVGNLVDYIYYYVTTATTVGYGDLSPQTASGRIWALFFVLPGSVAIFTATLGKAITDLSTIWRRRMNGLGDYSAYEGHTIVLGWQPVRTARLIALLKADNPSGDRIVLVAKALEQNPLPEEIDYVRADFLSTISALHRAGIGCADRVIIRGVDDDETLAATLAVSSLKPGAHVVAHFEDERAAELIARQCPEVEAISSLSVELLVRASRDPGASEVADRLLSAESSDTAFSMALPNDIGYMNYLDLFIGLKRHYDVTLVGISEAAGKNVDLNCPSDRLLGAGDTIFYVADERLSPDTVSWHDLKKQTLSAGHGEHDALSQGAGSKTATAQNEKRPE